MTSMNGIIVPGAKKFSHQEAMQVYETALSQTNGERIVVDLRRARDATSAAFARLVLLRKALRESGRDLCLINLRDRAAGVYHVHKLDCVLPEADLFAN